MFFYLFVSVLDDHDRRKNRFRLVDDGVYSKISFLKRFCIYVLKTEQLKHLELVCEIHSLVFNEFHNLRSYLK